MTTPKGLAARAVIETNTRKSKMVIEVKEGTSFTNFYQTYTVIGRGRNRTTTPGLSRHRGFAESLEETVDQVVKNMKAHAKRQQVDLAVRITIRIYRKRLYRKLLTMRPDELGLTLVARKFGFGLSHTASINVENGVLPTVYEPLANRWKIVTNDA